MKNQKPEEKPKKLNLDEELEKIRSERKKKIKLEEAFKKIRDMKILISEKAELSEKAIKEIAND